MNFASTEIETAWPYIQRSVERTLTCCNEVPPEHLDWRPPAANSNSLYVLASHSMHNIEQRLLGVLQGVRLERDRESEFTTTGTAEELSTRWSKLSLDVTNALSRLDASELERRYDHPERGLITGREILLIAARHMAEHAGQAELTRDLLLAALVGEHPAP